MTDWLVDGSFELVLLVGLPALFVVFLLKGAIVGKILPTSIFLPGYVLVISASRLELVAILAVTSVAYFAGQLLVYRYARLYGVQVANMIPGTQITDREIKRSTGIFERYGGPGIFVTNCVPFLGGLLFVPAGMTRYPIRKTIAYGYPSTLLYQTVLVVAAIGVFQFASERVLI